MASQEYDDFGNPLYENQPWERPLPYNPARRDEFGRLIFAYDDNLMDGRPRPGTEHAYFRDKNGGWIRKEALNGATPESLGLRPATKPLNSLNLNAQAQEVPPFADGIAPLEQDQMDRDIAGGPLLRFDEDLYDGRPRPGAEHLYQQDRNGNWLKSGGGMEKGTWNGAMPATVFDGQSFEGTKAYQAALDRQGWQASENANSNRRTKPVTARRTEEDWHQRPPMAHDDNRPAFEGGVEDIVSDIRTDDHDAGDYQQIMGIIGRSTSSPKPKLDRPDSPVELIYLKKEGIIIATNHDNTKIIKTKAFSGGYNQAKPIPSGDYDILERGGEEGWYRLDPRDSFEGNDRWDDGPGKRRFRFRLHLGTRSTGCVTVNKDDHQAKEAYKGIREILDNNVKGKVWVDRKGATENDFFKTESVKHFGTMRVYESEADWRTDQINRGIAP